MSTNTLIIILIILLILLIPLLLSYLVYPDEKIAKKLPIKQKSKPTPVKKSEGKISFEKIAEIFANKKSTKEELAENIEQLIKYHGKIHTKLGDLAHPDFKRYLNVIMALCSHPQADKNLIVALDHKLKAKNPKYTMEIDDAVNKGIAKRGF